MTGPSSGDRPAEETCECGHVEVAHRHAEGWCAVCCERPGGCYEYRPATPPVVRTGDDAATRAACLANWPDAEDGAYNPSCCRFPKSCSIPTPPPVSGTATRDDVALWLLRKFPDAYEDDDRSERRDADELLALGGSQPAQPAEEQRPIDRLAAVLAPAVDDLFASRGYPYTDGDAQFTARYLADKVLRDWKPEEGK